MKYHKSLTEFNCGVDLNGQQMYICVVDHGGKNKNGTGVIQGVSPSILILTPEREVW